jgi:hypothetical protein
MPRLLVRPSASEATDAIDKEEFCQANVDVSVFTVNACLRQLSVST